MNTTQEVESGKKPVRHKRQVVVDPSKKLVSLEDAAEQLDLSMGGMRSWVLRRQIDCVKVGARVKIKQVTIDEIIERGTVKALNGKRPMSAVVRAKVAKASA